MPERSREAGKDGTAHPSVVSAKEFLALPIPPLSYHIDGILPHGGKMTFSAPAKFGKSLLAMQFAMVLATGNREWLGMHFGDPAKVLYLQCEMRDALVQARLRLLLDNAPEGLIDSERMDNFRYHLSDEWSPAIRGPKETKTIEMVQSVEPDVVIIDPFRNFFPGVDENLAHDMSSALKSLEEMVKPIGAAIILIHHHGKGVPGRPGATTARGSSVFEGWPDSDLSATVSKKSGIATVRGRFRCKPNDGHHEWRMPNENNPWFEFVSKGQSSNPSTGGGPQRKARPEMIEAIFRDNEESLRYTDLVVQIRAKSDCKDRAAKDAISRFAEEGLISKTADGAYVLTRDTKEDSNPTSTD